MISVVTFLQFVYVCFCLLHEVDKQIRFRYTFPFYVNIFVLFTHCDTLLQAISKASAPEFVFNKIADLRFCNFFKKEIPTQMFFCEFYENFKTAFLKEHLRCLFLHSQVFHKKIFLKNFAKFRWKALASGQGLFLIKIQFCNPQLRVKK